MRRAWAIAGLLPSLAGAQAQQESAIQAGTAPDVVVSATRDEAREYDLPVAIDSVDRTRIREDNLQVNLSESLNRMPGIVVQNRQNYAQDLQVSSRGFGARSSFGARGVRLIADGIPATMPDGQGQTATFSLASAQRIEVLRGPFAALYGNASGGLVQSFTMNGPARPTLDGSLHFGSYGTRRVGTVLGGTSGALNYVADISRFDTDGYREHSAARREQLNAKLSTALGEGSKLTAVVNALDQPFSLDPLGLDRAQWQSNPRQAPSIAIEQNARKSVRHRQAGLVYETAVGTDTLRIAGYGGTRDVLQFLATPLVQQLPATSAGGVIDLDRNFGGVSLRYTLNRQLLGGPIKLTTGIEYDRLEEHRLGFVNDRGEIGGLKRDQDDRVSNSDGFVIGEWLATPRWVLAGGVRASSVRFSSHDNFVTAGNPDDSGAVRYRGSSFALGALFKVDPQLHLYVNAGRGFETPTLTELAYQPPPATGLNFNLQPSYSRQIEAGIKADLRAGQRVRLAAFGIRTSDEIVVNRNEFGRTDYKNAGRTERRGMEFSWEAAWGGSLESYVAWTLLDAYFKDSFTSGGVPVPVPAGNRIPGVPSYSFFGELVWRPGIVGWHAGVELRRVGSVEVNELNTEAAPAYTTLSLRTGFEQAARDWKLRQFLRIDNVTDRNYVGSVIVAANQGRYYEPAPGRNFLLGMEASLAF